jgi:hypothetical protein
VAIATKSGTPQTAANGMSFAAPLAATVTQNGIGVVGQKVTFTAPSSGASGTFANGTATDSEVTNSSGVATSSAFTANTTAGAYAVTATVTGATTPASFSLTNVATTAYTFYMSGESTSTGGPYSLGGTVLIDSTGTVQGGVQDFNDATGARTANGGGGNASLQPSGDTITGGSLMYPTGAPAGQGVLTLNTNNTKLGLNLDGVEVFGVQFVNASHALIMQFDGFATSSGSLDLQTSPGTLSGPFAFAVSGTEAAGSPANYGGVFSISGTTVNGTLDVNDSSNSGIKIGETLTGTIDGPDAFGRGTIKGIVIVPNTGVTLNYYVVGPKAIRLIDVSTASTGVGSAFSQGSSTFTNASLGTSVLSVSGTPLAPFAALGLITTSNTSADPASFDGTGDDNELFNGVVVRDRRILGNYSIMSNGYGSLNITNANLGNFNTLGVYMVDPSVNVMDPNNSTGGGGAVAMDLSASAVLPGGVGVVVPQTDPAVASFAGNYAAGLQNSNGIEFDILTQGSMTAGGALSLTGLVSDPFLSLGTPDATSSGNTFMGTPSPDAGNPGRFTMVTNRDWLTSVIDGAPGPNFTMIVYQANGQQLFWLDSDDNFATVASGPLQQQGSLTGIPAARNRGRMPANRRGQARVEKLRRK